MASLDWHCRRIGEVTLVELSVEGEFDEHVRIESRLTPVWPPREQGVPVSGWDGPVFEGSVDSTEPLVLGYATPARPVDPPAEITTTGTHSADTATAVSPQDVVRTLGESTPPRDALPQRELPENLPQRELPEIQFDSPQPEDSVSRTDSKSENPMAWLDSVASRLSATDRLVRATDADEARAAVHDLGGIREVRRLQTELERDRERLDEIEQRTAQLSEELSRAEVPLSTLERIV